MLSEYYGWVHYGRFAFSSEDGGEYGQWIWTERFGWMVFMGQIGIQEAFYSATLDLIITPLDSGNFYSGVFGWVWAVREGESAGTWFWSEGRGEWLGVTPGGGIWSIAEERFI